MLRANLNDIQVFMAVVDAGSFVAGGQTMGLSRSAAGKAIARLEQRLSVRLLHRTTRSLGLTDEGREFYRRGLQILASVDDAEASVAGDKGTARGVLRLTAPSAFGRRILLPLVPKFLVAWPEVQVEISFSDRLADVVEEGFDLAVRIGVTAPDTRLVSRTLARYRALLCASPPTSPPVANRIPLSRSPGTRLCCSAAATKNSPGGCVTSAANGSRLQFAAACGWTAEKRCTMPLWPGWASRICRSL